MKFNLNALVMLVDRTQRGGDEFFFDGDPITFGKGELMKPLPREIVAWLFNTDKKRVWTTDGEYVHRYGVQDCPQWLIDVCGPEVADCSPIEVDGNRLEGWDTTGVPRNENTKTIKHNVPPHELRERLGGGGRVSAAQR